MTFHFTRDALESLIHREFLKVNQYRPTASLNDSLQLYEVLRTSRGICIWRCSWGGLRVRSHVESSSQTRRWCDHR